VSGDPLPADVPLDAATRAEHELAARRLAALRAAIALVDAQVIALAGDRARLAREAAEAKRVLGLRVVDAAQEAEVRRRARAHAERAALDADAVDALLDALIAIGRRAHG
jgi:chorismate mutase